MSWTLAKPSVGRVKYHFDISLNSVMSCCIPSDADFDDSGDKSQPWMTLKKFKKIRNES